ncbi:MAG: bifunctional tetrahydrofolate synthase/dihydrofolate synthase [Betaproteobacteria bacterium]|nr:bifunctional tetrahydrofolate synthase/dihydrofolate synthase [Betaproteobacteria bacterium]MSQ88207.1 bifunctional tetrahydrofolate synthase/dihydrofolate synthase [Betaproteobacteria bacterium]
MSRRSLADWLGYIEQQHPQTIALGLERISAVFSKLKIKFTCPIITVGGTNGKGSTCAMLEAVLSSAGYRTGLYTSPHLLRYNERVRIAGREVEDEVLAEAFAVVEAARGTVPLTYFEFGTLAAFFIFAKENIEAAILEVGLGGRLDAVNVVAADCAVLTSIGVDHVEYLGHTREAIGGEKAGIFRCGRPAVVADPSPPDSVLEQSRKIGSRLLLNGQDFGYQAQGAQWTYWGPAGKRFGLPHPALRGAVQLRNASAAFAALDALRESLPVAMQDLRRALAGVALPGRFQVLAGRPLVVLDVAHNPEAAAVLAANLGASGFSPETSAVFGMLKDKDIAGVVRAVAPRITRWHLANLPGTRGADATQLAKVLREEKIQSPIFKHPTVAAALAAARNEAGENDKIVVFGSFLTVAGTYG